MNNRVTRYNPLKQPKKYKRLSFLYYGFIGVLLSFLIVFYNNNIIVFGNTIWITFFGILTIIFSCLGRLSNFAQKSVNDRVDSNFFDLWLPAHVTVHITLTLAFYYVNGNFTLAFVLSVIFSLIWESIELKLGNSNIPYFKGRFKELRINILSDFVMALIGSGIAWYFI